MCRVCLLIFRAGGRIAHGGEGRWGCSGWRDAAAIAAEMRHVVKPGSIFFFCGSKTKESNLLADHYVVNKGTEQHQCVFAVTAFYIELNHLHQD